MVWFDFSYWNWNIWSNILNTQITWYRISWFLRIILFFIVVVRLFISYWITFHFSYKLAIFLKIQFIKPRIMIFSEIALRGFSYALYYTPVQVSFTIHCIFFTVHQVKMEQIYYLECLLCVFLKIWKDLLFPKVKWCKKSVYWNTSFKRYEFNTFTGKLLRV